MLDIIEMLAPVGSACRPGYPMVPQYITIHNTANKNKGADGVAHAKYLRGGGKDLTVSYHYCVDDKQAVRIIPENENAWHAGDGGNGTGNRKSLAIEICENSDGDLLKATDNAVELTRMLMDKYDIPIENVKMHKDWSGKHCPYRILNGEPYDWETFIEKVKGETTEIRRLRDAINAYEAERNKVLYLLTEAMNLLNGGVING